MAVTDVTAENYSGPALPRGKVVLHDAYGGAHPVEVEIAANDQSRERGLMWRKSLPEGTGMLFVFRYDEPHSFWMRNTLIPLDMLFIDRDRRVAAIVQNAEPRTLTGRGTEKPTRYVLELPGGWTGKLGVNSGSTVEISLPMDLAVE